jgi:hypothetical protein
MKMNFDRRERRKMKLTIGILAVALMLTTGGARTLAQTETPKPNASNSNTEAAPTTYRLTYTLTELDGTKRVGTQHFSLTVNTDSRDSQVKLGSKVPILTGSPASGTSSEPNIQYQYQDVGLNITAHVREFATGVEVFSKLEQSSVAEQKAAPPLNDEPVIRQATLQNTALLTVGKPVTLGSLDIPGSTRHLDIEVVLEVVR